VLPGLLHLNLAKARLNDHISVGAQDVGANPCGAFTGEVSAEQLADNEIEWVLIGLSERRLNQSETSEVIRQKVEQAKSQNLKIIYVVGENLDERLAERT